jgi:hypothetical protein
MLARSLSRRGFSALSYNLDTLRAAQSVTIPRHTLDDTLKAKVTLHNTKKTGVGDRGVGLRYTDETAITRRDAGEAGLLSDCIFVVKIQPPLDNSDDAKGGIGKMRAETLLLTDKDAGLVRLVSEEEDAHCSLLLAALRGEDQVGYLYGEQVGSGDIRLFLGTRPPSEEITF